MRTFIVALIVFLMGVASAYSVQSETHPTNSSYSAKTFNIGGSAFKTSMLQLHNKRKGILARNTNLVIPLNYYKSNLIYMSFFANGKRETVGINLLGSK